MRFRHPVRQRVEKIAQAEGFFVAKAASRGQAVPSRPRRALRARTHILALILACLLPMLGLAMITSERLAETGRQASEAQILSTVRALAAAVDVKLKTGAAQLDIIATTQSMREGDFDGVYRQAVE